MDNLEKQATNQNKDKLKKKHIKQKRRATRILQKLFCIWIMTIDNGLSLISFPMIVSSYTYIFYAFYILDEYYHL
jgi:hypothetical protein